MTPGNASLPIRPVMPATLNQLMAQDPIGQRGNVHVQDGINILEL